MVLKFWIKVRIVMIQPMLGNQRNRFQFAQTACKKPANDPFFGTALIYHSEKYMYDIPVIPVDVLFAPVLLKMTNHLNLDAES